MPVQRVDAIKYGVSGQQTVTLRLHAVSQPAILKILATD